MNILIWSPPWIGQGGDLYFGYNAFTKHLLVQARVLARCGLSVTVAYPDSYDIPDFVRDCTITYIPISMQDGIRTTGHWADPSAEIYRGGPDSALVQKIADFLEPILPKKIDVCLVWETPAYYLSKIYPDATIIHQMPGAFARAPYPHTVIFDPIGLYRDGIIPLMSDDIKKTPKGHEISISFSDTARNLLENFPFMNRSDVLERTGSNLITLIPLQISDHYAFKVETNYSSQLEYCIKSVRAVDPDSAIIITEYVSKLYKDQIMTQQLLTYLRTIRKNVIFDKKSHTINSVTQHLLPIADEIVGATSGLVFQSLMWDINIKPIENTHISWLSNLPKQDVQIKRNILEFILTKHQPRHSAITKDDSFLVSLIEELHGRRSRPLNERLATFSSIDSKYNERLMGEFRNNEVQEHFINLGLTSEITGKASQYERHLRTVNPKLVSFDLFDTLVVRGFEQPADMYRLLELRAHRSSEIRIFDLAQKRLDAELRARATLSTDEIKLDDIYRCLADAEGIEFVEVLPIRNIEIEIEIAACKRRDVGFDIYRRTKIAGYKICVTSDMYLPKSTIEKILENNEYKIDEIYLSSEIGFTKRSGTLFDYIVNTRGLAPAQILHIGDNEKTDIAPASKKGLATFHVPRAVEYLWKHATLSKIFGKRNPLVNIERSVVGGAIANELFDDPKLVDNNSISSGRALRLGYAALGPLVLGYVNWIRRESEKNSEKCLYFLSREGRILKDTFDIIENYSSSGIVSHYLIGSRRAIRVAELRDSQSILDITRMVVDETATLGSLLSQRFGLPPSTISESNMRAAGFVSLDEKISQRNKSNFERLVEILEDEILKNASKERSDYLFYLEQMGVVDAESIALVDVGWNANMQGSMSKLLGRPVQGYYFATLEQSKRWSLAGNRIQAYYAENCTVQDRRSILKNRLMLENMLCDITPSVTRIQKDDRGSIHPVYSGIAAPERVQLVTAIQRGARKFVMDVCNTMGGRVAELDLQPDLAAAVMEEFLARPSFRDAQLFEGHEIEDSFSGAEKRYLLAPFNGRKAAAKSYWREGERALETGTHPDNASCDSENARSASAKSHPCWYHRPLMPFVRPFVRRLGTEADVASFNRDPQAFFSSLRDPKYRRIGSLLFPKIESRS